MEACADTPLSATPGSPSPAATGPGGIPLRPSGAAPSPTFECTPAEGGVPMLTNTSIALAEFASLLRPERGPSYLREHVMSLLEGVRSEELLMHIARTLERGGAGGCEGSEDDPSGEADGSSQLSPAMTVSESTAMGSSGARRPSHRWLGGTMGASMTTTTSTVDGLRPRRSLSTRREELARPSGSRPRPSTTPAPIDFEESILRTHLQHQQGGHRQLRETGGRRSHVSAGSLTDASDMASGSLRDTLGEGAARSRRRSFIGAAALGLHMPTAGAAAAAADSSGAEEDSGVRTNAAAAAAAAALARGRGRSGRGGGGDGVHREGSADSSATSEGPPDPTAVDPLRAGAGAALPAAVRREGRRVAVSAAPFAFGEGHGRPTKVIPKSAEDAQRLRRFVKGCHLFAGLSDKDVEEIVLAVEKATYPAGVCVLEQGQDARDCLFLLTEGTCETIKNGKVIGSLTPGGTFGELELMYKQAKCAATIQCITNCVIFTLDEESYRRAILTGAMQKRAQYEELTGKVPFLRCLPDYERMKIAEALTTRVFRRNQHVIRFGVKGTHIHFIIDGEVRVVGRSQGKKVEVVRLHPGDVFGELEFLFNHLTVADVIVTSRRLTTACISRSHFELIVGPIQDRLKEFIATSPTYETYYVSEVANASVRSELSRAGDSSLRKQRRRVAPSTAEGSTVMGAGATAGPAAAAAGEILACANVDTRGEIVLPARRALLHSGAASGGVEAPAGGDRAAIGDGDGDGKEGGGELSATGQLTDTVGAAGSGEDRMLFRFPLFPLTERADTIVLGLREDGAVLLWNDALAKLTSYPAEEVVGQNIYSFLLDSQEQQAMLQAITDARNYAGDVDGFFTDKGVARERRYTLARSDGLTRAVVKLSIVPPLVSHGDGGADMLLAYGEEVKQSPHQILDPSQWLSTQVRAILADGAHGYEERLQLIADAVNSYEATYRALTMSTEKLRVVNIRQMLGQVLMDFGVDCVQRDIGVRQRFEGLPTERVYLDAELLPECLRYAMRACLAVADVAQLVITVMVVERNGLEFLVINFNVDGEGFSPDCVPILDTPLHELSALLEESEDKAGRAGGSRGSGHTSDVDLHKEKHDAVKTTNRLTLTQKQQLRRVREVVEQQGGTMRVQRNTDDANLFFLIPFMPASEHEPENASVAESLSIAGPEDSSSLGQNSSATPSCVVGAVAGVGEASGTSVGAVADRKPSPRPGEDLPPLMDGAAMTGGAVTGARVGVGVGVSSAGGPHPAYNFTTLVAEDTPAHRNMLCSYLWERRHAVLPAYSMADVDRLAGVADILFIDLHQSIIGQLTSQDPIALLREKARQMAVVITAKNFDDVSAETYHAAGFITLKKPCTPVQAMQAIRRAEEKMFAVKQEAERIAQVRETLARNSRGAWKRGRLLGKGSFGEVFEAVDVLTGGKMAVKEMRLDQNTNRIEMFVEEVATMCNLRHPNIIHYFYCEQSSDLNVIRVFMEYAAGGTLQGLLSKRGKLPFTEFQSLLRDITEGLAYIHAQNYVHCDLKTANVLLNHDGMGKIGDFGTARTLPKGGQLYDMQGSPLYMSPECMSAGDVDEDGQRVGYSFPTDVWSLGCVALEMATNKPPFSHIGKFNGPAGFTCYITSLTDTPDLSPLFDGPPSIIEFVSACLNPDPARRATAQQLLQMSIFSEGADEDTKSAVQALQRAQLLHVLNKFVAFQEPEEARATEERKSRFKTHRRETFDFFDDSSSTSSRRTRSRSRSRRCSCSGGGRRARSRDSRSSGRKAGGSEEVAGRTPRRMNAAVGAAAANLHGGSGDSSSNSSDSDEAMMVAVTLAGEVVRAEPSSASPDPARATSAEDTSPTPRQRSRTLSQPPPPTAAGVAGAKGRHGARQPHEPSPPQPQRRRQQQPLSSEEENEAEAAFFATSSSSSAVSASSLRAYAEEGEPVMVSNTAAMALRQSPPQTAPLPAVAVAVEAAGASAAQPAVCTPAHEGGGGGGGGVASVTSSDLKPPQPYCPEMWQGGVPARRNATIHHMSFAAHGLAPLLAASFTGRSGGGAAAAAARAALSSGPSTSAVASVAESGLVSNSQPVGAVQPAGLANASFYSGSFVRNLSFVGASMDEVLHSAANDFLSGLASAAGRRGYSSGGGGGGGGRAAVTVPSSRASTGLPHSLDSRSTGDRVGSALDPAATVNTAAGAVTGGRGTPSRSPSPLPERPTSTPVTASSSRLLDAVEVDTITTATTSTAASGSVSRSSSTASSPLAGEHAGPAAPHDLSDVRLKIARKLRKARSAIANRSFFRIEDLAGPLGAPEASSSWNLTGFLASRREGSHPPSGLHRPPTLASVAGSHEDAESSLAMRHAQTAPQQQQQQPNSSVSFHSGPRVLPTPMSSVGRLPSAREAASPMGEPGTPASVTEGNMSSVSAAARPRRPALPRYGSQSTDGPLPGPMLQSRAPPAMGVRLHTANRWLDAVSVDSSTSADPTGAPAAAHEEATSLTLNAAHPISSHVLLSEPRPATPTHPGGGAHGLASIETALHRMAGHLKAMMGPAVAPVPAAAAGSNSSSSSSSSSLASTRGRTSEAGGAAVAGDGASMMPMDTPLPAGAGLAMTSTTAGAAASSAESGGTSAVTQEGVQMLLEQVKALASYVSDLRDPGTSTSEAGEHSPPGSSGQLSV